ncbi:hypothetical protein ACFWY9_11495, partial [Amycolatopsis sp. NPDC059027]
WWGWRRLAPRPRVRGGGPGLRPPPPPTTTSCELSTLPGEEGAAYRVRAFFTGPPSPLAHQTTGAQR